ncbi:MAG: PilZ domain-containing protein [Candidatus Krumholzibacteria bacterium]|jgi:c-di-GMP-binding flagellar brake protein YcgR|nr:PilZ domain-containing protein [Candidatus Krumholzibacteria bacterium]
MIRETLTAIGQAGRHALETFGSGLEVRTQVSQVREWSFAMPHLARVTVANSPIHQIYVGISQPLAKALRDPARHEVLLEEFKKSLVARVPAKRPIGAWEIVPPDGRPRALRGLRSFILRQQTRAGNLYLMADVASRGEYESQRQSGWEDDLAAQLLPRDLARLECVESPVALNRVGSYLTRFEHDVELLVPVGDDEVECGCGVVVQQVKQNDRLLLAISVDFAKETLSKLAGEIELEGSFGAAGRVFRFRTRCRGQVALPLEGVGDLPCVLCDLPDRFHLDQRRRYFRVQPEKPILARLAVLPPLASDEEQLRDPNCAIVTAPAHTFDAEVVDLSFSGLALTLTGEPPAELTQDSRVRMWLSGEELPQPVEVTGAVRRLLVTSRSRGRYQTDLGLEFLTEGPGDRHGTQVIRQYVMAQQRRLLVRRSADAEPVSA